MLKLYNTLSRKKETLKSIKKSSIGLYTCGPTVYDFAHIGNLRTYIFEDVLERTLRFDGYNVKRVMNITDVGHLTSDADLGEDKLEKGARRENKSPLEVAARYTKAFLKDIRDLHIRVPKTLAPATKFIKDQIALVSLLVKNGYAYETPSAVYFDVAKSKKYGRLSRQSLKQKMTAARKEVMEDSEKRNPADFALWFKCVGRFAHHILRWKSPWGDGFPGWHIECSAIARRFLGQPFDIHTGGVDHIGTHHENEIAQSEAAYGVPLANLWLHGEHLMVDGGKMSKSAGTFITLEAIRERGIPLIAFRYLVLGAHYRSRLNFTWTSLEGAASALRNLYAAYAEAKRAKSPKRLGPEYKRHLARFTAVLNDDLNTPQALATLATAFKDRLLSGYEKAKFCEACDEVLGLGFKENSRKTDIEIPKEIKELAARREQFRANKQFTQADALREELDRLGYKVEDTEEGPHVWPSP